ncbi:MAG: HNH endonuclease, partial [Planctomycetaceae bacterium]|nr:HNH endonuclease [Planctomycetaceae bacterium]
TVVRPRKRRERPTNRAQRGPYLNFNSREFRISGKPGSKYLKRIRIEQAAIDPLCRYCGSEPGYTLDHGTPRSRGGTDVPANLHLCCTRCNMLKEHFTLEEWRDRLQKMLINVNRIITIRRRERMIP